MQHISSYFGFINALRDRDRSQHGVGFRIDLGPEVAKLFAHLGGHARGIDRLEFLGRVERRIDLQSAARNELDLIGAALRDDLLPLRDGGSRNPDRLACRFD
jgi:hypothetical protein